MFPSLAKHRFRQAPIEYLHDKAGCTCMSDTRSSFDRAKLTAARRGTRGGMRMVKQNAFLFPLSETLLATSVTLHSLQHYGRA
jgi:hypothetical protein